MDTIKSAVNTVLSAITPAEQPLSVSRAQVIALEEQERQRRVDHASQSHLDQQNARKVANIVQTLHFPVLKNSNTGFKKYTRRSEEYERKRRLENRVEFEMRKLNALKVSGFITSLGWPFTRTHQGPEFIYPDQTAQQEELERRYRLNNPMLSKLAKQNAANVAGIARWAHFKKNPLAGSKRRTRALEEKERKRRLLNTQELELSCANGYTVARCIRSLGPPFFVQGKEFRATNQTNTLEEKERVRRMHDKSEQSLAREQASKISSMLPPNNSVFELEDKERDRRLLDFQGQQLAKENAAKVANLLSATNVDALERRERERRLNSPEEQALARQTATKVSSLISSNQRGSKYAPIDHLESLEREHRLANPMEQMYARQNASQVANLISQAGFQRGSSFSKYRGPSIVGVRKATSEVENLEAQEKARRLADIHEQEQARTNARNVAMLLQEQAPPNNTLELENLERERRVADSQTQQVARANAQKVSGLIRTAYWQDSQKSLAASDIELGYSYAQPGSALPTKDRNLGLTQPQLSSQQFTNVYTTSGPSPAPLTYVGPSISAATVPTVTRGLSTVHTERERKVLAKAAAKHAKLASKESRRAEQKALKAEHLHSKGKDARAAKYEANAEQHALAAKHHQQWSNEAKLMSDSATDPSLIPTISAPSRGAAAM